MVKLWRWVLALVLVPVVLVGLGLLYLSYGVPIRRHHVAVPPAQASPADVLRAYVAAVDANDHATQEALSAQRQSINSDFVRSVTGVHVGEPTTYRPGPWDGAELNAYHHAVILLLSFRVHFWPGLENPQQSTGTYYLLVRNNDQDPWRIWGAGAYL